MSEANREILSAGMDGELSREEIRFLLRRLEADPVLADTWARFHVARDGLRKQGAPLASGDFASRVMAAIEAEPSTVAAPRRRWLQWSAGGAIAASVAVAALMISQPAGNRPGTADIAQHAPTVGDSPLADATPAPAAAPVAPQWLSGGSSMASQFTQKAAFDSSEDGGAAAYLPRSTPYQIHRARAATAPEGNGYMLMIRPDGTRYVQPVVVPQAR
ncbi:sigma-E factor negative regulatory protein RseA [Luteibacter jiangsuensis]|uniref:Sigma-E factor negative regulatory protein RseA n=1 Tax=Luteibacter jiangsuensis TaxID=637577 RepID=A0ABT9STI9_9GAMM|nr:sigma-E factor negative regulatory protein [Luteibacter jiangsuensis]MDQ0007854.1 sigma-E factor negative regulatory protein RseA [Luteibacter jiangsuensis]